MGYDFLCVYLYIYICVCVCVYVCGNGVLSMAHVTGAELQGKSRGVLLAFVEEARMLERYSYLHCSSCSWMQCIVSPQHRRIEMS